MPVRRFLAALFAVALVLVVACGSDDDSSPAAQPTISPAPTSAPVPPTAVPDPTATAVSEPPVPPDEPTTPPEPTPTPDAVNGEKVFLNNQCAVCHSTGTNPVTGPGLAGILERAATRVEGMSDVEYIEQSIRDPGAFVVDGFPNVMPDGFGFFIPESDIQDLMAYLKTLN